MVKIPELTKDGQNWKIYCVKFLEVAATFDCLEVLAGRPYEGDDWDGCNALLCCMFMETVAPSIYFKIRRRTMHKNFKYLAKHFCDSEPIPRTNEFQCAGTAAAAETPENYPTSMNTATEQLVNANSDEDDLSTTQDPRTSTEAPAEGTSAKCAETTSVMLKSMLHKMQIKLQSSLPLTPRPPIDGEPCECKQEVADDVVTAGRMNQTAKMAKPQIVDVKRTTLLGGEPAERVSGVDEGDGDREYQSQIQQTNFYCEESCQRNENANENVPIAHGVPLEGEWTWCASGEASDSKGNANAFNAAIEHTDGSDESTETVNTKDIKLEGCKGGMDERASIDDADGSTGREVQPADTPNELEKLVTLSIKSEDPHSGEIPHMHLRGMNWRACNAEGLGSQVDMSKDQADWLESQADVLRGWMDTLTVSNHAEMAQMSCGNDPGMYLATGDARRIICETNGLAGHADTSTGQTDAPSVKTDARISANEPESVSIPQEKAKLPDLPMGTTRGHPDEPDGCRNHLNMSSIPMDSHSIEMDTQTAENETETIRTSEPTYRWRRVSAGGGDVYVPLDAPIKATSRMFAFRQVKSAVECIAEAVVGKTDGEVDGDQDGDGDDVDGTTSSDTVNST
ncbi:hypothetical protein SCLCIDRAFT_31202 [Scleroderma citrinum Foug A]|uniref:Uncharacterized protein n=1 Tax=Scleroderma citrinum Foug A TaxID=1036808 RepID=A0A0C3DE12_9AGAM|nr:hypothetical protein SCLCIDRAFT_31202 [Scleroderma citrinum Foug A]